MSTWTLTSDRTPEAGRYIVTVRRYGQRGNKTSVSQYYGGTWYGYDPEDIIAYMPLPEPYQEDDE